MNPALLRLLIAVSLVANLALGVKFAGRISDRGIRDGPTADSANAATASVAAAKAGRVALAPDTWDQLTAGGDPELAKRLLAAGFPRDIARNLIGARVHERLADLEKLIADARINTPFWRQHLRWKLADEKIRAAERALSREEAALMRQLWDVPEEPDPNPFSMSRRLYGDLPADTVRTVARIREERMQQMGEIKEQARDIIFQDELDQIAQLDHDDTKAVAGAVMPEEFTALDRRLNPTTGRICSNPKVFEPTAEELRALVESQQPFDEQTRDFTVLSPAQAEARATARAELHRQAEALLGSERFAAYLNAAEKTWLEASRFTLAHQLPPAATEQILAIQSDFADGATARFPEASARLTAALGAENLAAYRDGPGVWFRNLKPAPPKGP